MATADKALERAKQRTALRKGLAESLAESQVKIARERGRVRRSVERTRATQRIVERQQSERARQETVAARNLARQQEIAFRGAARTETRRELAGISRQERLKNQVVFGATGASPIRSTISTLMTLTAIFFVLVVVYVLVTNATAFGGFLSTTGNFIHGLSSNAPLFVKTETE